MVEPYIREALSDIADFGRLRLVHQSDGQVRHRRPGWRRRPDRSQNHRRHLRRRGASWRRGVFRQGYDEGRSFRGLRSPLPGEERGCSWTGGTLYDPAFLRHWRRAAAVSLCRPARHGKSDGRGCRARDPRHHGPVSLGHPADTSISIGRFTRKTAAYGHFGRKAGRDGSFGWERLDLVKSLKDAVRQLEAA